MSISCRPTVSVASSARRSRANSSPKTLSSLLPRRQQCGAVTVVRRIQRQREVVRRAELQPLVPVAGEAVDLAAEGPGLSRRCRRGSRHPCRRCVRCSLRGHPSATIRRQASTGRRPRRPRRSCKAARPTAHARRCARGRWRQRAGRGDSLARVPRSAVASCRAGEAVNRQHRPMHQRRSVSGLGCFHLSNLPGCARGRHSALSGQRDSARGRRFLGSARRRVTN